MQNSKLQTPNFRETSNPKPQSLEGWFCTPERIALLDFKAGKWLGTPFRPNSCQCGRDGGVSCQKLASAIYRECGFCDVEVPEAPMSLAMFSTGSNLVEPFMEKLKGFIRLDSAAGELQPGDLIVMRIKKAPHHIGIMLSRNTFIHAMDHVGTILSSLTDGTYGSRLVAAWRPVGI